MGEDEDAAVSEFGDLAVVREQCGHLGLVGVLDEGADLLGVHAGRDQVDQQQDAGYAQVLRQRHHHLRAPVVLAVGAQHDHQHVRDRERQHGLVVGPGGQVEEEDIEVEEVVPPGHDPRVRAAGEVERHQVVDHPVRAVPLAHRVGHAAGGVGSHVAVADGARLGGRSTAR